MKKPSTIKQLEKHYNEIKTVASGDTKFMAICSFFIAKKINELTSSGIAEEDKLHWLMSFLKNNMLVIGEREGDGFKQISFEELHELYQRQ